MRVLHKHQEFLWVHPQFKGLYDATINKALELYRQCDLEGCSVTCAQGNNMSLVQFDDGFCDR